MTPEQMQPLTDIDGEHTEALSSVGTETSGAYGREDKYLLDGVPGYFRTDQDHILLEMDRTGFSSQIRKSLDDRRLPS